MVTLTIEEVLAYAKPIIYKFIHQHASDAPFEQKQEIEQTANLRLLEAFPGIDQDAGWKSYVFNHSRGAVLDYLKFGKGFQESKWSLSQSPDESRTPKLTKRIQPTSSNPDESQESLLERAMAQEGIFYEIEHDKISINWDLALRLASKDQQFHIFLRVISGQNIESMAEHFGLVRTRISQLLQEFIDRFDDPARADESFFKQIIFALGLCRYLRMEEIDQGLGYTYAPVDLEDMSPHQSLREQASQTEFNLNGEAKTEEAR